jgi:hypothetical protein
LAAVTSVDIDGMSVSSEKGFGTLPAIREERMRGIQGA